MAIDNENKDFMALNVQLASPRECFRSLLAVNPFDRDQITRRSWHCVQKRVLEYTIFTDKSSRKFSFRFTAGPRDITLRKGPAERR